MKEIIISELEQLHNPIFEKLVEAKAWRLLGATSWSKRIEVYYDFLGNFIMRYE